MCAAIHVQLVPESTYEQRYNERNERQMAMFRKLCNGAKQAMEEKITKLKYLIFLSLKMFVMMSPSGF